MTKETLDVCFTELSRRKYEIEDRIKAIPDVAETKELCKYWEDEKAKIETVLAEVEKALHEI